MSNATTPIVFYRTLNVTGLEIFYRELDSFSDAVRETASNPWLF